MRTTLKRSIGQVDGLNGNGHSPLPPLVGPVARYRQPGPPNRSLVALLFRGLGWLVLAIVVVARRSRRAASTCTATRPSRSSTAGHTRLGKRAGQLAHCRPVRAAIALVAGYDHRSGTGTNAYADSNSDTLMLLRADPKNRTLSLLSFPRDLAVNIYCKGNTVRLQDRINAAWADCGTDGPAAAPSTRWST